MEILDRPTTHHRLSFMEGTFEIGYLGYTEAEGMARKLLEKKGLPTRVLEKKLVLSADSTGTQIDEIVASGRVDAITSLSWGVSRPTTEELGEQRFDLSRLTALRDVCVWYPPVPESLFTAPGITTLELASLTPSFARVGRPYPSLKKISIRAFEAARALTALPSDIENLTGLAELHAIQVGLRELPDAIGALPIEVIDIYDAKSLKKVPARFGPTLRHLRLAQTGVKTAPDTSAAPSAKIEIG
jgi:hypothetical protein